MSTTGTQTKIPFLDLSRQHKEIEAEIHDALVHVLSRGSFVLGDEVSGFEASWSAYCGAAGCAGVANGTDAISLALLASGSVTPGRGDEVITSTISAGYTALAILQAGAVPVFADVDPLTLLIDPRSVEQLITSRTTAIVPVRTPADERSDNRPHLNESAYLVRECRARGRVRRARRARGRPP